MEFASLPILIIGGTAAILIPVLIHLFNRTRFQVTDWAAMEFLLAALKKTRRRVRLENLLLLFLRILILVFLAMMLARPSVEGNVPLAKKTHYVLIIDDSWSMSARYGNNLTAFDRARELIRGWINRDTMAAGNAISLIPTSARLSDFRLASLDSREGLDLRGGPAAEGDLALRIEGVRQQLVDTRDRLAAVELRIRELSEAIPPIAAEESELALREELKGKLAELQGKLAELQAEQAAQGGGGSGGNSGGNESEPVSNDGKAPATDKGKGPPSSSSGTDGGGGEQSELYTTSRQWIIERLDAMNVTLRRNQNWLEPLAIARAALRESADRFESKRVFLISDMQRINLPAADNPQLGAWRDVLTDISDETSEGVRFMFVGDHAVNRTIVSAELSDRVVGTGVPLNVRITLRNNSTGLTDDAQNQFRVRYRVDGGIYKKLDLNISTDAGDGSGEASASANIIKPGTEATVSGRIEPFTRTGIHTIDLTLDDDAVETDNRWFMTVEVRKAVNILVVDGSPGEMPSGDEIFFFMLAVPTTSQELHGDNSSNDSEPRTLVVATDTTREGIDGINFFDYDVVLLANVESLSTERRNALETYVKAGNSVIFTMGDRINEQRYNADLWRNGKGLFPVKIPERSESSVGPIREVPTGLKMEAVKPWHRTIRGLAAQSEGDNLLDQATFYQFFDFDWSTAPKGLRRIANFAVQKDSTPTDGSSEGGSESVAGSQTGPALLFSAPFGRGEVMVYTSPLDGRWDRPREPQGPALAPKTANTFVGVPSYITFWTEMLYALTEHSTDFKFLHVGDIYRRPVSPTEFSQNNFVFPPGTSPEDLRNGRPVSMRNRERSERDNMWRGELFFDDTDKPGIYTLKILKRRDPLERLVREVLDQEATLPASGRRTASERITNGMMQGEADTNMGTRKEVVRIILREVFPGLDEDVVHRICDRLASESEELFKRGADNAPIIDFFVVNVDTEEGRLTPIGEGSEAIRTELTRLFPGVPLTVDAAQQPGQDAGDSGASVLVKRESRIWKFVAFFLLVLLGLEMVVALLFTSRQR